MAGMKQTEQVVGLSTYMADKRAEIDGLLAALEVQKENLVANWRSPEARMIFDRVIQDYRDEASAMVNALQQHADNVKDASVKVTNADSLLSDSLNSAAASLKGL
ncbi:WXG100 family type VII secretion target [Nocardia sp. alder85J]|uniref:WXG100 family type VII secretion target n=1 Tax=Nocardia sp. alder85J TaxID=2862949 RepID=UPI001CD67206|nr:WXG100 family type VII secretion target [Nocardia sp. alder85J]MCX4096241.1 WXG100 family type VII secretion target [Nocardia sp. alder85J]